MNKSASGISLNVFHNERVVIREITLQIEKCVVDDGHMSTCQENAMYSTAGHTLCTDKLAKAEFATTTLSSKLSS